MTFFKMTEIKFINDNLFMHGCINESRIEL